MVLKGLNLEIKGLHMNSCKSINILARHLAYTCSPSYLGGLDWEDCGLRSAQASSSQDPISKITKANGLEVGLKQ
jgi:hypothetical protein